MSSGRDTYETTQPWVLYHFGLTHDGWWPLWTSTRVLGRARIRCTCCVCGDRTVLTIRMPRFGQVPDVGHHPARSAYLAAHEHVDRGHPISWALPMSNLAVFGTQGLSADLLAMRLEADINDDGGAA